jgi:dehydrogenase/reductase SDR family protein 7B
MYFKDKTVWITGASSGIGKALAIAFSKQHARLILSSRNEGKLNQVRDECRKHTKIVHVQPLDLEEYHLLPNIAKKVMEKFPKIDVLINNGGISQRSLAIDTSLAIDKRLMDINYMGTVALSKSVLPSMLRHDIGHIVTITSLVGKFGTPLRSSYAASKHALHGFFDSLRAELEIAEKDVKITLICPGYIRTKVSFNALTGDGSPQNSMDNATNNGLSPKAFAKKALNAIRKQKNEVYIGKKEVYGIYLRRFLPKVFDRMISKTKVT